MYYKFSKPIALRAGDKLDITYLAGGAARFDVRDKDDGSIIFSETVQPELPRTTTGQVVDGKAGEGGGSRTTYAPK